MPIMKSTGWAGLVTTTQMMRGPRGFQDSSKILISTRAGLVSISHRIGRHARVGGKSSNLTLRFFYNYFYINLLVSYDYFYIYLFSLSLNDLNAASCRVLHHHRYPTLAPPWGIHQRHPMHAPVLESQKVADPDLAHLGGPPLPLSRGSHSMNPVPYIPLAQEPPGRQETGSKPEWSRRSLRPPSVLALAPPPPPPPPPHLPLRPTNAHASKLLRATHPNRSNLAQTRKPKPPVTGRKLPSQRRTLVTIEFPN